MSPKQYLVVGLMIIAMLVGLLKRPERKKLLLSSLTGKKYVEELLRGPNQVVFDLFRMDIPAFLQLCKIFRQRGWVKDSKHVDVEEKIAIFLLTISHNLRNRLIKYRFQHSGQTISKCFHEVLLAMLHFSQEQIVAPSWDEPIGEVHEHQGLREGPFKGAVGALDGTLVSANIPADKQIPFRARGGKECFQSVLAVCDFDMKFVYVMAGWEGIAHDAKVLNETLRWPEKNQFPMPPEGTCFVSITYVLFVPCSIYSWCHTNIVGKYYLCDAAYTNTRGFLSPFKNARYWLKDFRNGGGPRSREEAFNHGHSQLRNVIERAFGVLKARFKILKTMPPYKFRTQVQIVIASMAIHNFLRRISLNDQLFQVYQNVDVELPANDDDDANREAPPSYAEIFSSASCDAMSDLRDQISQQMFDENF